MSTEKSDNFYLRQADDIKRLAQCSCFQFLEEYIKMKRRDMLSTFLLHIQGGF